MNYYDAVWVFNFKYLMFVVDGFVVYLSFSLLCFSLPDDDRAISVFDYFVDESGEWDTWETK